MVRSRTRPAAAHSAVRLGRGGAALSASTLARTLALKKGGPLAGAGSPDRTGRAESSAGACRHPWPGQEGATRCCPAERGSLTARSLPIAMPRVSAPSALAALPAPWLSPWHTAPAPPNCARSHRTSQAPVNVPAQSRRAITSPVSSFRDGGRHHMAYTLGCGRLGNGSSRPSLFPAHKVTPHRSETTPIRDRTVLHGAQA